MRLEPLDVRVLPTLVEDRAVEIEPRCLEVVLLHDDSEEVAREKADSHVAPLLIDLPFLGA